tara:strand:+ start:274 stop:564 length:291 start_codon:yes stop_codon:yes gene_type:complete
MNGKALEDLYKVMQMEGLDRKSGRIVREKALSEWVSDWVVEVNASQSIIKQGLTSEDEDFIKYYMAYKIGDELMEECINVESTKTKISTKVWALKR